MSCTDTNNIMLRRKTVFRLVIWMTLVLIICIIWYTTLLNIGTKDTENFKMSRKYSGDFENYQNSETLRNTLIYPKDINLIRIPEIKVRSENFSTSSDAKATGLTFRNKSFYLNNQPFRIFSGAVHYFRIVPEYWEDRLRKLKACGLNTVETYIPWNLHEPSPGHFNFYGVLDLKYFLRLATSLGLYVILRPGPFICAEFEFGGLPAWLMNDPNMQVRTNYPGYISAVNRYFSVLLPLVHKFQFTEGGPIIMYQVENEYTVYGQNTEHLKLLLYLMKGYGVKEFLVTSDHKFKDKYAADKNVDFSKYALPTDNLESKWSNSFSVFTHLNKHFPLMIMELWTGWFDFWGKGKHATTPVEIVNETLNFIMNIGGSFNLYMFIGGTNFGFTSGANNMSSYQPMVTSYDYNAILSEAGDITLKYTQVRNILLQFYKSKGIQSLPPVPANTSKGDYGSLQVSDMIEWSTFLLQLPVVAVNKSVSFMETYTDHQGHHSTLGYIVYSYRAVNNTHLRRLLGANLKGQVRDRLTAILDDQIFYIKDYLNNLDDKFPHYNWDFEIPQSKKVSQIVDHRDDYDYYLTGPSWRNEFIQKFKETMAENSKGKRLFRLHLMVENLGRVNYSNLKNSLLNHQRKGLSGQEFRHMSGDRGKWDIRFINFNLVQYKILSRSRAWVAVEDINEKGKKNDEKIAPALYRAYLDVRGTPNDTFVKLDGWTKGVVLVNGFNLGRYWHIGPQKTLYLPAPVLRKGRNEILIFEEIKRGNRIKFQHYPELS